MPVSEQARPSTTGRHGVEGDVSDGGGRGDVAERVGLRGGQEVGALGQGGGRGPVAGGVDDGGADGVAAVEQGDRVAGDACAGDLRRGDVGDVVALGAAVAGGCERQAAGAPGGALVRNTSLPPSTASAWITA